ncbi:putative halogenase [Mycena galericulata]|nr:putative halogenase [Mycena galericulata]KAJ7509044.1 putative halogenase [Mycena galericulata]
MPIITVPTSTEILIIGGGPAGAYAASALTREGFNVTLLEKEHFPRYHIGESMLPSCRPFLRFIGAEDKVVNHGFAVKVGAAVKLNQYKREGYTDFTSPDPEKAAWNVVRSEFDEILLRHAAQSGASVFEGIQVTGIKFSHSNDKQPVSAEWKSDHGATGEVRFKWLVDASGRTGIMSTKYLKNRKFNQALKNIAFWGYWTGAGTYEPGTKRENAPWFEALTDETGWAWFIPLHNGTVSVGVVLKEECSRVKKSRLSGPDVLEAHYLTQLKLAPGVLRLLGCAKLTGGVRSAGDYSYSASHYAGPNYRIAGDAGAFIDPFFSSGVHLAFANGLSAASTISASIRGHCTEGEAIRFHNEKTGTSYTRFLLVVLSIYRQINSQAAPVLSDVDEDNFDRAFDFLRPIIQGAADTDHTVTEATLQSTMDFCEHALGPTTPEMHAAVAARIPEPSLLARDGPLLGAAAVAQVAGADEEAKQVLLRVNARKAVDGIYDWERNFTGEKLGGFAVVLKRGELGLRRDV